MADLKLVPESPSDDRAEDYRAALLWVRIALPHIEARMSKVFDLSDPTDQWCLTYLRLAAARIDIALEEEP